MLDRSFTLEDKKKQLQCTYVQPRLILTIQSENQTTSMTYTTENLPVSIKEDCESILNLYEYLSQNSEEKIQVGEKQLKFKTVGIKKEKWFSLPVTQKSKDQNYLLNRIRQLQAQNAELKQLKVNHCRMIPETTEEELNSELDRINQQKLKSNQVKIPQKHKHPLRMHLTINFNSTGFKKARMEGDFIEKRSDKTLCMLYCNQEINRDRQAFFKVKIIKFININWFVIGVITQNNFSNEFAYGQPGCICFSVSMKSIYVETNSCAVNVDLKQNDTIKVAISILDRRIQWMINETLFHISEIPLKMLHYRLYPFMQLSKKGDVVQLNCE